MTSINLLAERRRHALANGLVKPGTIARFVELEERYGRYLYLPLDLPDPKVDDAFRQWFAENSQHINKVRADVAGGYNEVKTFRSIDRAPMNNAIWQVNVREDVLTEFPAIGEYLAALPYEGVANWSIWSSNMPVSHHRDEGPWYDLPCAFRLMLFDTNPAGTLIIRESPVENNKYAGGVYLPRVEGTRAFAWNNLRVTHASTHDPAYEKALLITHAGRLDLDRYEDLMERSLAKYGQHALVSSHPRSDFSHI